MWVLSQCLTAWILIKGIVLSYYRLYFLDPDSGRIDRFEEFNADDDATAVARAEQWLDEVPLELWSGARKVVRLDPIPVIFPSAHELQPAGL